MAGKRQATTDLNHENWDREEEPEERGTFRTATEEEIKSRVMKKARRKIVAARSTDLAADASSTSKSLFSGFSGFGNIATQGTSSGSSPFSFLSKLPDTTAANQANKVVGDESSAKSSSIFKNVGSEHIEKSSSSIETIDGNDGGSKSKEYCSSLISLNHAFRDWINLCIDKDPLCYLTPVFKDYEQFLTQLDQNDKKSTTSQADTSINTGTPSTIVKPTFSFSSSSAFSGNKDGNETNPSNKKSIFGDASSSFTAPKPNGFSLNVANVKNDDNKEIVPENKTALFSFTPGAKPFTFGNVQPPVAATENTAEEDDEENQPPKTEFKQVVEEDAIYSKKCKVFVKKDNTYGERGVGTLYLKPVKDSPKTQLLVRADTNLGNVLVNLILSSGIPVKRMGKNNVLLVCVPTPEEKTTLPLLLRVKNETEADDLLATITKYQK